MTRIAAWATLLLFPVFFRKVHSSCGGPEGGDRLETECACLFNRLVSQPAPILRT